MTNLNELIAKAKQVTESGLDFMEGKTKTDFADGDTYIVKIYGFLQGDNGEDFVVVSDGSKTFAYGGMVITEAFKKLESSLDADEMKELLENGIPMKISKRKSKNGFKYTSCVFFPEAK